MTYRFMRKALAILAFATLALLCSCRNDCSVTVEKEEDGATVTINGRCRYLLLPIQEKSHDVRFRFEGAPADVPPMEVKLAADSIDFYLPLALPEGKGPKVLKFDGLWPGAVAWTSFKTADSLELPEDSFRPVLHHSPLYGWMNDPNGMFFKDGEYHLYYQYNPYGCTWGNMHWGHSVSRDLVHWERKEVALRRDSLGHIYSGSCVVDEQGRAGYGKGAVIAYYTAHKGESESQCMAWSTDGGNTFHKYEGNPVIVPADGIKDFRDPKVIFYEPDNKWVMAVAARYEVRFYESFNLRDWNYTGSFGQGYGAQPSLWECPDMIKLKAEDGTERWALLVNIHPGGLHGGSGTEYFVGDFNGKTFVCDTPSSLTKWLDYGKDHYAAVTFSNVGEKALLMGWMNNWQYADRVPSVPFRSANTLARELRLFNVGPRYYIASLPCADAALKQKYDLHDFKLNSEGSNSVKLPHAGPCRISFNVVQDAETVFECTLSNQAGEEYLLRMANGVLSVDRSHSGLMTNLESFNTIVSAPLSLCDASDGIHLDIWLDKASVEIFADGGRLAITQTVFPSDYYDSLEFSSSQGKSEISSLTVYELGL